MKSLILKHLSWLRGVTAALAVLGFVPEFTPLEKIDLLRALHATIIGWNDLLESVGIFLHRWLSFPQLSAAVLNVLIIGSTVFIPSIYVLMKQALMHRNPSREEVIRFTAWTGLIVLPNGVAICLIMWELVSGQSMRDAIAHTLWASYSLAFLFTIGLWPSYRNGCISVVIFVLTFELLYFANTADLRGKIDSFVCTATPEACDAETPTQAPVSHTI